MDFVNAVWTFKNWKKFLKRETRVTIEIEYSTGENNEERAEIE